jgi:hypothetical protein
MERIVRILEVVDTREYEEGPDGKFRPVPGSGTEALCERCGRPHEVHARVELSSGRTAVVGTGCAAASWDPKEMRGAESAAKRVKKLEAEAVAIRAQLDRAESVDEAVYRLAPPPVVEAAARWNPDVSVLEIVGGPQMATTYARTQADLDGIYKSIVRAWREEEAVRRGGLTRSRQHTLKQELEAIVQRHDRALRQLRAVSR